MTANGEYFVGPVDDPDKYRLVHQVGTGGEAQLWKAELSVSGEWEPVAVKILRPDRLGDIDRWAERWAEQAEVLRFLRHPGVVGVREHFLGGQAHYRGEAPGGPNALYLVMNWVDGEPIRDWVPMHRGPDAYFESLRYLAQVGDVLDWLHSGQATPSGRPVIHADVTPANVLVTAMGQAVLVDFGLTRLAVGQSLTVEGTGGYIAPEVLAHGNYSPGSDRYSFGALTYFVLTGQNPPVDLNAIRSGFEALPTISGQPDLVSHLMVMFDPDADKRPPAGTWIRFFRTSGTTSLGGPHGLKATPPLATSAAATQQYSIAGTTSRRLTPTIVGVAALVLLLLAGIVYAVTNQTTNAPRNAVSTGHSGGDASATTARAPTASSSLFPATTRLQVPSTTTTVTMPDPACTIRPGPNLTGQDFSSQNLSAKNLACADAHGVNFSNANLKNAVLDNANLTNAILTGTTLTGTSFKGAHLQQAKLVGANPDTVHVSPAPDFSAANLTGADLESANLGGLGFSEDVGSVFVGANLSSANLSGANLQYVNFSGANLTEADMTNTVLYHTNLAHASVSGANFSGAKYNQTICPDGTVTSTGPCT